MTNVTHLSDYRRAMDRASPAELGDLAQRFLENLASEYGYSREQMEAMLAGMLEKIYPETVA